MTWRRVLKRAAAPVWLAMDRVRELAAAVGPGDPRFLPRAWAHRGRIPQGPGRVEAKKKKKGGRVLLPCAAFHLESG